MSTQQPSQNSQPDPTSKNDTEIQAEAILKVLHEDLKRFEVDAGKLVVANTGFESYIGEAWADHLYVDPDGAADGHGSIFEKGDVISLRNPKVLTKVPVRDQKTGGMALQVQIMDLDFVETGIVEVKPVVAFFLDWCDYVTQVRYCRALLGFFKGRQIAAAKAAGIVLPGPEGA